MKYFRTTSKAIASPCPPRFHYIALKFAQLAQPLYELLNAIGIVRSAHVAIGNAVAPSRSPVGRHAGGAYACGRTRTHAKVRSRTRRLPHHVADPVVARCSDQPQWPAPIDTRRGRGAGTSLVGRGSGASPHSRRTPHCSAAGEARPPRPRRLPLISSPSAW